MSGSFVISRVSKRIGNRGEGKWQCMVVDRRIKAIFYFSYNLHSLLPVGLGKDDNRRTSYELSTSLLSFDTCNVVHVHSGNQSLSYLT